MAASIQPLPQLILTHIPQSDADMKMLGERIGCHPPIGELNLHNCSITAAGLAHFTEALKSNEALYWLRLQRNAFGNVGLTQIAQSLQENRGLRTLDLSYNELGERGHGGDFDGAGFNAMDQLGSALKVNSVLTNLYLGNNNIGDGGLWSLAQSLYHNRSLTHLDLTNNPFTDVGAQHLIDAITAGNSGITSVNVFGNLELSAETIGRLQGALASNRTRIEHHRYQTAFASLSQADKERVYYQVWILAGSPSGDPLYGEHQVFADWQRFLQAVTNANIDIQGVLTKLELFTSSKA